MKVFCCACSYYVHVPTAKEYTELPENCNKDLSPYLWEESRNSDNSLLGYRCADIKDYYILSHGHLVGIRIRGKR